MFTRRQLLAAGAGLGVATLALKALPWQGGEGSLVGAAQADEAFEVSHTDNQWRTLLSPEQYRVLRQEGDRKSTRLNSSHT